jgi:hypothetical protein
MSDITTGVYRIPDSSTYLSGHQKGGDVAMLFGLLGVLAENGINKNRGEHIIENAQGALKVDMPLRTRSTLKEKLVYHHLEEVYRLSAAAIKGPSVTVLPYVVLTFTSETTVRPFVILKVSLTDPTGRPTWWTRYICAAKEQRALEVTDGWSRDGGAFFQAAVACALDTAVDVVVRDLGGKLPRPSASGTKLKTHWAFAKGEIEIQGELIEKNENDVIFAPKIGDVVVFSGINIFEPDLVQLTAID